MRTIAEKGALLVVESKPLSGGEMRTPQKDMQPTMEFFIGKNMVTSMEIQCRRDGEAEDHAYVPLARPSGA